MTKQQGVFAALAQLIDLTPRKITRPKYETLQLQINYELNNSSVSSAWEGTSLLLAEALNEQSNDQKLTQQLAHYKKTYSNKLRLNLSQPLSINHLESIIQENFTGEIAL